jgi:hypothetical protein
MIVAVLAAAAFTGTDPPAAAQARLATGPLTTKVVHPDEEAVANAHGARLAALDIVAASQRWLYLDDGQLAAAVRAIALPSAAERLARQEVAEVATARESLAKSPGRVWWIVHPLAWRVATAAGDQARVSVWTLTLLSAADVAIPQADWLTFTLDLSWSAGRWLLTDIGDEPGPTPASGLRDEPWQPEPFDKALDGFTRVDGAS